MHPLAQLLSRSVRALVLSALVVTQGGCAADAALPAAPGGGPCAEGETRPCGQELGEQGESLACLHGVRRCEGGTFGECEGTEVVHLRTSAVRARSRLLALTSNPCANSPCDPSCRIFEDVPDAGWFNPGDGGGDGGGSGGGADGGVVSPYQWPGGSLSDYPPGLVKKGLSEPCQSAFDCQFNTRCTDVATGPSCGHDKCATGAALGASCDDCVSLVCDVDSSCCGGNVCQHSLCVPGVKLDAGCSPCAGTVCAANPDCCTTGWTTACVDAAATLCGACTCGAGQPFRGGSCYRVVSTVESWDKVQRTCANTGPAWDLVVVDDAAENDFVRGLVGAGSTAWIGMNDRSDEGEWVWTTGSAGTYGNWGGGEPDDALGAEDCALLSGASSLWKDTSCTSSQRSVCEAAPVTGCASGQTASGSRCYKIDDGTETHAVHRADCQALGAGWDLAVIGDAAENAAIAAITSNSRDYHIGYTDEAVEGTWLTVGGAAPAYTAWWSEPDGGDSADCVFLGQAGDRWADGSCTTSRDYACEGPTNAVCPSGWTAVGARCMQAFSTNRNFASAEADCVTRGGHLATVESAAEVASVQGITGAGVAYWIGANDLTTEGAFAWTSGSASTYTNWPNAPDGGSAANCARMDAAGGTWQDDSCTDSGDSVCEGPKLNGCPSGWTQSAGRCVRVYSSTQITRTAASNACVALGGSLATVVDAADNAVILRLTTSNNIFWIGPTDVAVEGTWVTPSGGALPYTNWSGGAAPVTAAEDCAGFNDNGGTWTDYDCSTNRRYVCELPLAPLCPTGTTENTGRCYDFETANRTFAAARTFCQTYGAGYDLAVVGDATENEWIRSNLANAAYLGLTDAATEGTWLDVNGSAPAYTNWYAPFPDGGVAANCVSLSDTSGFWDDQACSSTRRYVCERAPVNCQTGTVERGGHCYKIETSGASFASARTTCQALGAGYDLITVDDAAEDTWLASQTVNDTWIGLSDAVTEGTFLWTDGAAPTYTNFDAEPNSGDASDCAYFDDANARWYDMPCGTARRAVCEGPQSPVICPSGFTLSGGRCYEFVNSTLTHAAAEANCQSLSAAAHLATVSSAAENARIVSLIGTNKSAWIGFTDQATEGTFTWIADEGSAYTAWAGEPNDKSSDDCGYTAGDTGVWKSDSCSSPKRAGICEGPAQSAAAAGTWDADCVAQVASVCGATCGTAGQGLCSPWLPTEQNPACPTLPDLSLGPACEGGVVPVCNHGGVDAPAGVTLAWFSANSGHYPTCTPDLDRRKDTPGDCVVPTPIPAGECVSITCPGMTNNAEIVVNPPDASQIAECNCADNWSLYDKNAVCGPPECSAGATQATLRKANLYVMVDRSTSMSGAKWDGTVAALRSFFASTQAAGVGVALEFFPLRAREVGDASGDGCGMDQGTCSPALCSNPFVSLGTLTADPAPTDAHEAALVATLQPNWLLGSTPSWPALVGALEWAEARQLTHPNEVHAVVFATDGQPYGSCNLGTGANTNTQLAVRAGTALANGVRTYTIGMQGANQAALDAIAASGGTSTSFFIDSADPSTIATDLRTALGRIVGQAASCSFTLPNPDLFDPTSATVTYRDSGGTETDLPQVAASGDCGTGWYYNDPSSPTVATLCPDSCATVRADDNARVEIHLGCPLPPPAGDGGGGGGGSLGSGAIRRRYEATCDGNRVPQWSFLTYRTTVAPDATLSFRLRTAPSAAELATATFLDVATIPTAPAVCELSGPAPTCPVDVFNLLGGGAVTRQPLLEIEASATAPTSIPSIDEIHLTYSCLDSQ